MSDTPLSEAQPVRTKKAPSLKTTWSKAMRKSNLIPAVKNTASAACEYANSKTGARIFPGVDALAEDTGQSRRTIISHMDVLEKSGWLKCLMRGKGAVMVNGKRMASEYQLAFPEVEYTGKGTVTFARAGQAARKAKREADETSGTSAELAPETSATLTLGSSAELAPVSSATFAPETSATLPTSDTPPEAATESAGREFRTGKGATTAPSRATLRARIAGKKSAARHAGTPAQGHAMASPEIRRRPADTLTEALGRKPSTPQVKELEVLLHDGWDLDAACREISHSNNGKVPAPVGAVAG